MSKGTIYYDESSRGLNCSCAGTEKKRGRWVGEKIIDGRRVRMRSTNLNRVLAWLNDLNSCNLQNTVNLKGYPHYKVDIKREVIYGYNGKPLRGSREREGWTTIFRLKRDGKCYPFSLGRIIFAATNGLSPEDIPDNVRAVRGEDGMWTLRYASEEQADRNRALSQRLRNNMVVALSKREVETKLLKEYYQSGETNLIIQYIISQTEDIIKYVSRTYHLSPSTTFDIATHAIERFCQKICKHSNIMTSITYHIRAMCRQILKERRNTKKIYHDNFNYVRSL